MPKHILLADDSSTIRRIVELCFDPGEFRVQTVADGTEALQRIDERRPDLVLADVVMPGPDGYELCRRIKDSAHPVPVLLLAGAFEPIDPERAQACGADGHLVKPFEAERLREAVRRLLAEPAPAPEPPAAEAPVAEETPDAGDEPVEPVPVSWSEADEPEPVALEGPAGEISAELVDAVARAVVRKLSVEVVREIAREVVPEIAETVVRERIRELESDAP